MKGILLAGGNGTRLSPLTKVVSKQLLPVYNKPMIYYPLSVLIKLGIRDILIISSTQSTKTFFDLLGTGKSLGIRLSYRQQDVPNGIAQALNIGRDFFQGERVTLILGDNLFFGKEFDSLLPLANSFESSNDALVFTLPVENPCDFGVATLDQHNNITNITEKPTNPSSNLAVLGLYCYPPDVSVVAQSLSPSARGEYEITDVNKHYVAQRRLKSINLSKKTTWFDCGCFESLNLASNFVAKKEAQGIVIGDIIKSSKEMGFI